MTIISYDDLVGVSVDRFYTYDDLLGNVFTDDAFAGGSVTRDGPAVTVDWSGAGTVDDGLSTPIGRDDFIRSGTLVPNGTFETGIATWNVSNSATLTWSAAQAHSGTHSILITPPGGQANTGAKSDPINILPNTSYTLTGWVYSPLGWSDLRVSMDWNDSTAVFISSSLGSANVVPAGVWTKLTLTATSPINAASVNVRFRSGNTPAITDVFYGDDMVLVGPIGGGLGTSNFGQTWAHVTSWIWGVDPVAEIGYVEIPAVNVNYQAWTTSPVSANTDIIVKFKPAQLFTGGKGTLYLYSRFDFAAQTGLRARFDFNQDQIMGWGIESLNASAVTTLDFGLFTTTLHTADTWYWARLQTHDSVMRIKIWPDTVAQPTIWFGDVTNAPYTGVVGVAGMSFFLASTNTNALPYAVQFGKVFMGATDTIAVSSASTSMSLDDGMPSGATNTSNLGVSDISATVSAPVGVDSAVYFSQFRSDQYRWDIPRDVPGVTVSTHVVAPDGIRTSRLFTGQMSDLVTGSDGNGTLKAISQNRLLMSTLIQPPAVHGFYEGAEGTWAVGYALWKSGLNQYPPLIPGCRLWMPANGSGHVYVPDTNTLPFQASITKYHALNAGHYASNEDNMWIDGPFPGTAAPNCGLNSENTALFTSNANNIVFAAGDDFLSQAGSKGRIELWIRGDETSNATSLNSTISNVFQLLMSNGGARSITLSIPMSTRIPRLLVNDGTNAALTIAPVQLPVDGKWHFLGAYWDVTGNIGITLDGNLQRNGHGGLSTSALPLVDDVARPFIQSCVPIADLRMTTGKFAPWEQALWNYQQPWTPNVIARRCKLKFQAIAEPAPRQAYEYISALAQAELATIGFDKNDNFCYLPLSYWAEDNQQAIVETLSTNTNLGRDFKPIRDLTKIYNQVVVTYKSAQVQEVFVSAFDSTQVIALPARATTTIKFPATNPLVELRGTSISVLDGPTLAASPPNANNISHYVTANTALDGSGTYASTFDLVAVVSLWDPGSVTVKFTNTTGGILYVANNVNLPAIAIGGKVMYTVDQAVTEQSDTSILQRGPRVLPVSLPIIQNANDAAITARELVGRLASPRLSFTSSVWADGRRYPGMLVRVMDDDQRINDIFRLTGVSTTQQGDNTIQSISAVQAWPVMVWGQSAWGRTIWR